MKTPHAAAILLLVGPLGCDRIHALFSHDEPTTTTASADSAAPLASASAPTADKGGGTPSLAGFEGEIDLTAKQAKSQAPVALNLLVKNDIIRFDLPNDLISSMDTRGLTGGGKVYGILKTGEKKLVVVLDGKQQAVVLNLDQLSEQTKAFKPGAHGAADTPVDPPKVVKTGKKETVAGFTCEDWDILNADNSKASACVADTGTSFFHLPLTGLPTEHAWALELMDGKHFPVKGIAFDKDGTESGRVEVTKIDKRPLEASQFEVPAGYKQLSIQEMLQGLGGGALPPGEIPRMPKGPHPGHRGHHHKGN